MIEYNILLSWAEKKPSEKRGFVDNSGEDNDFQLLKRYDLTKPFKRSAYPLFWKKYSKTESQKNLSKQ